MSGGDIVIVFDCGATNVRAIAIDSKGSVIASHSSPNNTSPDPFNPSWRIWDTEAIWQKMCTASKSVTGKINCSD
ncbi:MAG TPA: FGGY family carbohydrate kinase, partial [Bacteroidales bacterium]|nr:FGGY family carbohydrate kinase [Bacteroidales bacterium]